MSTPSGTMRSLLLTRSSPTTTPTLSFTSSQPVPTAGPGELLIRVHASAIQPSDIYNARGGFGHTSYPRVPGRDWSGVVAGPASSALLGTAVFGSSGSTHAFSHDGFQAEYAVVPEGAATPKPAALSHAQAAVVGVPFTTTLLAARRARIAHGETVLVLGANGAVGSTVCVVLRELLGCKILRGVRGPKGDVDTAADPDLAAIQSLTGGRGVDAVIDTVGMPALTRAAVDKALAQYGRLAFIAAPKTAEPAELAFNMQAFYRAEKELIGVNSVAYSIEYMAGMLDELKPLFESGKWQEAVSAAWDEVSLEDAPAAYESKEKGKKFVVKIA